MGRYANFVWFHTGMGNEEFKAVMASHGVQAARAFPPMEEWCRLSVGLPVRRDHCFVRLRTR